MQDNGERIYAGLMELEDMQKLEEENQPPIEKDFLWENDKYKLPNLLAALILDSRERALSDESRSGQ